MDICLAKPAAAGSRPWLLALKCRTDPEPETCELFRIRSVAACPHRCCCDRHTRYSRRTRSEEHTSELQSLMRISYAVFCLKKKTNKYEKLIITPTILMSE